MRRVVCAAFVSLDGVMQAPGGPEEDPTGGFAHGGWTFPHWDEVMGAAMGEDFGKPFDLLLGRKTYEIFAAHWPHTEEPPADLFNRITKYVATSSAEPLAWANSVRLEGDAAEAVARLKQDDGPDLLTQGSSVLVQSLLAAGLVDELSLLIFPVLLGRGKKLFGDASKPGELELISSQASTTGVIIARYRPAGPVRTGSFQLAEPSAAETARRARMARRAEPMAETVSVTVERRIAAPPELVFDAWLDPDAVGHWLFATPDGVTERVEIDPRVGGGFRIEERRGTDLAQHFGEYVEIDRPRLLAFDFWTNFSEERTRVTVTIARDGDGALLTLRHEGVWADYEARTRQGWTMILDGLARTLAA